MIVVLKKCMVIAYRELMERDVEKAKSKMAEKGSSTAASDDSSLNDQLVVKSYVDAIIDRTKLLLYVTMATDDPSTPLTSDYKGEIFQIKPTTDFYVNRTSDIITNYWSSSAKVIFSPTTFINKVHNTIFMIKYIYYLFC